MIPIYLPSALMAVANQAMLLLLPLYALQISGSAAFAALVMAMRGLGDGHLRRLFVEKLEERNSPRDFSFIANERGMFSFLGISREEVIRLREEYHVYMVESSRMNFAGINKSNVDYVTDAVVAVL